MVPVNLNTSTNSLRAEAGDQVVYAYTNNNSVAKTVTTAVQSVTTSSGQNGTIVDINCVDSMPQDLSFVARGMSLANNVLTVAAESSKTVTAMSWTSGW